MKKSFMLIVLVLMAFCISAQSPQKMSYQFVVRDAGGELVTNHGIGVKISILQGTSTGTVIYQELFNPNPQSNANGLVSIEIGTGLPITGSFPAIDWADGPYFLKTETDPTGATNYTVTGTSELLSVPYSLYSKISGDVADNSINSSKISDGTIVTNDLGNSSVTSAKIADGTIASSDLSTGSVTSAKIYDLGIASVDLADGSVTLAKIADGSVTSAKIADGSVANADLADNSVNGPKLLDLSIGTADLADGSVTSGKIADGNIATADIANGAVTITKISNTGAAADYVMQYTGSSIAWDFAPGAEIKYTVLNVNCNTPISITTTYVKVASIGSFTKLASDSRLEVTFHGRVQVATFTESTGAIFELRVDDAAANTGRARAVIRETLAGYVGENVSMTGIFSGLGTGTHTVSVWARTFYGTGTEARVDPGCWQTDHVIVREIK